MANRPKPLPMSAAMADCLADATNNGGRLIRYPGGRWTWPDCPRGGDGWPVKYHGATTVNALVIRGELEYVVWKQGRNGRFPIAAKVVAVKVERERVPSDILMAG